MQSIRETFDVVFCAAPAARTDGTVNSTGVDISNYADATVLVIAGARTDGSHAINVQHSDNNTDWDNVPAAEMDGTEPTIAASGDASKIYRIGYLGAKRYLRAQIVTTGSTTGAIVGTAILRSSPRKMPK